MNVYTVPWLSNQLADVLNGVMSPYIMFISLGRLLKAKRQVALLFYL